MSVPHVNEIALVGKLSKEPAVKPLASGRSVYEWRLVVLRPADRPGAHDTIDCVSYAEDVQKAAADWRKGDLLALRGALRRHFWQNATTGSPVSRYDVEVWEAQLLTPATNLEPTQPPRPAAPNPSSHLSRPPSSTQSPQSTPAPLPTQPLPPTPPREQPASPEQPASVEPAPMEPAPVVPALFVQPAASAQPGQAAPTAADP